MENRPRDTRETVEEDYRYAAVDAMLDLMLEGAMTLEEVKEDYEHEFGDPSE